ncbi:MAG: phospholipid carrier-dependent glycosyltransferase [Alphaproteobacteria bacterium]|nr:phospholipid carrier-dependent glycosyltransferase [Alphaproteobacteria bacterium]
MKKLSDVIAALPRGFLPLMLLVFVSRILSMAFFPLTDATEGRYGEVARLMLTSGDWISPQYAPGVWFWAKPPMSTWLAAASMKVFGVNEFAARFPSLLLSLVVLWLVWELARDYLSETGRWLAVLILSTMSLFYVVSGTVMTDETLLLTCTMVLVAFWRMVDGPSRKAGYWMFFGLGLGLLAKGPVVWALTGISAAVWLCWAKKWREVFRAMPLVTGALLMLAVGVPWYIAAEMKTPGFLNYFLIGENFDRFTKPGWDGDRYGHAHKAPLGMIWVFVLAAALPWLPVSLYRYFRGWRPQMTDMTRFLLCWFLIPNLFFTFAHNIILTYPLVSLPPLALLIAKSLESSAVTKGKIRRWAYAAGAVIPAIILLGLAALPFCVPHNLHTASFVSRDFRAMKDSRGQDLLYVGLRVYSIEYYNAGKVKRFDSIDAAIDYGLKHGQHFLALTDEQAGWISPAEHKELEFLRKSRPAYVLYQISPKKEASGS